MKLPKLPFNKKRKTKRPSPQTPTKETFTLDELFTLISETMQEIKQIRILGVKSDFDIDSDVDVNASAEDDNPGGQTEVMDIYSVSSFSTMTTMDDSLGSGRILDKHLYQPARRFISRFKNFVLMVRGNRGGSVPSLVPLNADTDNTSLLSVSSTSTATDLPGTGRIIDKYIYGKLGAAIERCMGRIAMSYFLSARVIYDKIELLWYNVEVKEPCFVCRLHNVYPMTAAEKVRMAVKHIEDAPSGMFILAGMKELTKRLRSKCLYRRVEARIACYSLFNLDALHVLKDVEGVVPALKKNKNEDEKKLFHQLSARARKLERRGKELPLAQKAMLFILGPHVDERVHLPGKKPRMGNDMLPVLKELLPKAEDTISSIQLAQQSSLVEEMIRLCLLHSSPYLSPDVPCQKLTELLEGLYLALAYNSVNSVAVAQWSSKSASKRSNLFNGHWPNIMRIVKLVSQSYVVTGCQECGACSSVQQCLCLDRIVVLWRIIYLFTDDESCVYENVLRDANNLCRELFVKCTEILLDTSEIYDVTPSQAVCAALRLYDRIAFASETHIQSFTYLRKAILDAQRRQKCEHGTRYQGLVKGIDFWDEKRLQLLTKNERRRHSHLKFDDVTSLLVERKALHRNMVKGQIEEFKAQIEKRRNMRWNGQIIV